jgi:LPPG:FO 2-phospho-L-lactate transferase
MNADGRVIAISPIVGGAAVRGPAADMMATLANLPPTAAGVASYYSATYPGLVDVLVLDNADAAYEEAVARSGMRPLITNTLIGSADARRRLAEELAHLA